jgi:hypothetical protein
MAPMVVPITASANGQDAVSGCAGPPFFHGFRGKKLSHIVHQNDNVADGAKHVEKSQQKSFGSITIVLTIP